MSFSSLEYLRSQHMPCSTYVALGSLGSYRHALTSGYTTALHLSWYQYLFDSRVNGRYLLGCQSGVSQAKDVNAYKETLSAD